MGQRKEPKNSRKCKLCKVAYHREGTICPNEKKGVPSAPKKQPFPQGGGVKKNSPKEKFSTQIKSASTQRKKIPTFNSASEVYAYVEKFGEGRGGKALAEKINVCGIEMVKSWHGKGYETTADAHVASYCDEIVDETAFGDYQGDYVYLIRKGNKYAIVVEGYGSCSGCDYYEGNTDIEGLLNYRQQQVKETVWYTPKDLVDMVKNQDRANYWYRNDSEYNTWVEKILSKHFPKYVN